MKVRYNVFASSKSSEGGDPLFTGEREEMVTWLKGQRDVKGYVVTRSGSDGIIPLAQILMGFVPKFYMMDPKTEDLLPNGRHLRNGMKVLIADSAQRGKAKEMDQSWMRERLMRENRWCTVTELQVINNLTTFIGVYDDGVKFKRSNSTMDSWLVKLSSVIEVKIEETERYSEILSIIKTAFDASEEYAHKRREGDKNAPSTDTIAENAAKAILGTLG